MQAIAQINALKNQSGGAGPMFTPPKQINRDEALATIQFAHTISLWQTPQEPRSLGDLVETLKRLLLPATKADAGHWIARLLQNFPARQTERDAVIISDLSGDLEGLSHSAIIEVCDELRRESSDAKPFLPVSGEIYQRVKIKQQGWEARLNTLQSEKPRLPQPIKASGSKVAWAGMTYEEVLKAGLLDLIVAHCRSLKSDKAREYAVYLKNHFGFPADFKSQL